jgi:aminoglycoside phosphotransferase (APT) family kinase protein
MHGDEVQVTAALAARLIREQFPRWAGLPLRQVTSAGTVRLTGVIDFDAAGLGDPSLDLIVAWMLLPAQVRPAFRRATGTDRDTWLRGRARALAMALGHLRHYRATNSVMADNASYTIREVLADYQRTGE